MLVIRRVSGDWMSSPMSGAYNKDLMLFGKAKKVSLSVHRAPMPYFPNIKFIVTALPAFQSFPIIIFSSLGKNIVGDMRRTYFTFICA